MAIQTDIRIHDRDVDGFDYQLREDGEKDRYIVTHSGKYVGCADRNMQGVWTVYASAVFGTFNYGGKEIGHTAGTMADAVAILHAHWASVAA